MRVLDLTESSVKLVRRRIPQLAGKRALARGTFAAIFEATDAQGQILPDRVLKLTMDPSHHAFLTDPYAPSGTHHPVVFENFGDVGENDRGDTLYLVEMERLVPLPRGGELRKTAARVMSESFKVDERRLFRVVNEGEDRQLQKADFLLNQYLRELNSFVVNYDCSLDHQVGANFMARASTDTLVFSDPVYDNRMYARYSKYQRNAQ